VLRVFIIDEVRVVRDALAALLRGIDGLVVVGLADPSRRGLRLVAETEPDVTVVNASSERALEIVRAIRAATSTTRVVAFGLGQAGSELVAHAEAGIGGYVTAEASIDEFVDSLWRARRGEILVRPDVSGLLFERIAMLSTRPNSDKVARLTRREREVASLLTQGLTNKEIALHLSIEVRTVKNHVHHILEKLECASRREVGPFAQPLPEVPVPH
jgi:two-component system nitrate/nitrite response regulator NarL